MADDASAYAVLGLPPGADWPAVERAYKDQIKRHHPDRSGGDAARAAEIIHAYRELKRIRDRQGALMLVDDAPPRRRSWGWLWVALAAAAAGLLVPALGPRKPLPVDRAAAPVAQPAADPMNSELSTDVIAASLADALRIFRTEDEMALASASRGCHRQLRADPNLEQLDRCAAFDDAVVMLQDRDPLRNQGPFGELAVTSRQLSAATLLSGDALAIDGRLDRIRLHVELALAPLLAPPPLPPLPEEPANATD